ncbi:hypothetical protein [Chitinophaga caseinilytica]|uniref:DUF445 family protein n=1 Tax=Chitinophaga caseinilytica TaxID=2267521 RepID=A0ABZ2YWF9_9BACT
MLYLIPLLTAFTGWFVNRAALWLLFRPANPLNLGLFTLQGAFPKRQQQIAQAVGNAVSQFVSFDDIRTKLTDPEKISALKPVVEEHLDHFLRNKLPQAMPMISMFIGDSTINQIKTTLAAELDLLFPKLIGQFLDKAQADLDLSAIVSNKIAGIASEKVEAGLRERMGGAFTAMGLLGAGIGLVIGLLQLWIAMAA